MIGVLIIAHGSIGAHMLATASQILGAAPARVVAIDVGPQDDPEAVLARARAVVAQIDDGAGVLVLTDMFGATPGNIAARLLADGRIEGVTGLSLPMLVRALSGREGTLEAAVKRALSGGAQGVLHMNRDGCRNAQR